MTRTKIFPRMHVSLDVLDIDRSVAFYNTLLGVPAAKHFDDYAKFECDEPPLLLSLNRTETAAAKGALSHLGLQVAGPAEVAAAAGALAEAGLETVREEGVACCYAVQDKVWVRDPDGNAWEVFTTQADIPERDEVPAEVPEAGGSCCGGATGCIPEPATEG